MSSVEFARATSATEADKSRNPQRVLEEYYELNERIRRNNPQRALELAQESLRIATELKDESWIAASTIQLGYCYDIIGQAEAAHRKFEDAHALYLALDDRVSQAKTLHNLGMIAKKRGDYVQALHYYDRSRLLREECGERNGLGLIHISIGNVLRKLGRLEKALEHFLAALNIHVKEGDRYGQVLATHNIGNVCFALGQYERALKFFRESLSLGRFQRDRQREAATYCNMGYAYHSLGDNTRALSCLAKALDRARHLGDPEVELSTLSVMGTVQDGRGDHERATALYRDALRLAEKTGNQSAAADVLHSLGDNLMQRQLGEEALSSLHRALRIAEDLQEPGLLFKVHQSLASVLEERGDIAAALRHYKEYATLRDELHSKQVQESIIQMQTLHDLDQARSEKEIYRLKNVELAESNRRLTRANSQLRTLDKEKNDLLGIVAHDLQNPLAAILRTAQNLGRMPLDDDARDNAAKIELTARTMTDIISDLLDISMVESGAIDLQIEQFNLIPLLHDLRKQYTPALKDKQLRLHLQAKDKRLMVRGGRKALRQILDNLLSNAIKYSPAGRNIFISAAIDSAYCRVAVRDEGPGLTKEDKARLYGKFTRLSARPTAGEGSTGAGLWIVKKLAEMMDGTIVCESEPDNGATFILSLPAA